MSNLELLDIFDAWKSLIDEDDLSKARGPKGLKNWSKLSTVADKLEGKQSKDITFTTCHPDKKGQKKHLGSVEGNLHFLMGYANPGFHLAKYHWMVIDPLLSEEEAEELHKVRGHPSRPELWKKAEMEEFPEGDLELGMPHPSAVAAQEEAKRQSEGIRVGSGLGVYLVVPSEGLVYGEHNDHVYTWDLVKDSFLAATNPSVLEKMKELEEEPSEKSFKKYGPLIPDTVTRYAVGIEDSFDHDVYPLVKSMFPVPGSIIPVVDEAKEEYYGVVSTNDIKFYNRQGTRTYIYLYDKAIKSLDLLHDGTSYASTLVNFATEYLNLNLSNLNNLIKSDYLEQTISYVEAEPTPGFDNIDSENIEKYQREVVKLKNNTFRVVLR